MSMRIPLHRMATGWFADVTRTPVLNPPSYLNLTGTSLRYKPGIVTGGAGLVHECGTTRGIGYFLEPLIVISLFGKKVGPA